MMEIRSQLDIGNGVLGNGFTEMHSVVFVKFNHCELVDC